MDVDVDAVPESLTLSCLWKQHDRLHCRCLHPPVTLAPVRRGEGRGEGSVDDSKRLTLPCDPLTLTLSPEDGGEGIG